MKNVQPKDTSSALPALCATNCVHRSSAYAVIYVFTDQEYSTYRTELMNVIVDIILHRAKKFRFNIKSLFTLYLWFVRTGLEYAAPVWHSSLTQDQSNRLERVQKRCFRIILGGEYTSYGDALTRLKCTSLQERRKMLSLRFGKSLLKSQFHRDLLPPTVGQVHGRNTRHRQRLQPIRCTKEFYRKSTIPYIVSLLNHEL